MHQLDYTGQLIVDQKQVQLQHQDMMQPRDNTVLANVQRSLIIDQQQQQHQLPHAQLQHQQQQVQHSPTVTFQQQQQRGGGTLQHRHVARLSRKQRLKNYMRAEIAKFFGVDQPSETHERIKWCERQKRLAIRRFGPLTDSNSYYTENYNHEQRAESGGGHGNRGSREQGGGGSDRPDILPTQNTDEITDRHMAYEHVYGHAVERKASVYNMALSGLTYVVQMLSKKNVGPQFQWSRSFAPTHCLGGDDINDLCDGLSPLQEDEVFFEIPNSPTMGNGNGGNGSSMNHQILEQSKIYMGERVQGWRTKSNEQNMLQQNIPGLRGSRISAQCLDGVLDNSR